MSNRTADCIELFSSIQGEGMMVGLRQVFLRFHGCNLSCDYCDTVTPAPPATCQLEGTPGRRDFHPAHNPVTLDRIVAVLEGWQRGWPGLHHSLSLTGGEPLLRRHLADLVRQLDAAREGVVLAYGQRRSTFLPQVWEQVSDAHEFLRHLKAKAGLAPDFWSSEIRISRYSVEKWSEE